ncbi:MAG TPA: TAXI family TRAP transporter solute-binding subunit [Stellaceae bacterium]|nr:TAXI family TRAP transporter solute-binding subunit [Stellaceae bacterium]
MAWHRWRGLVCASLLFAASLCSVAAAEEPRFFRIGTAATGGSLFEVGGMIAGAISSPIDAPACDRGGSCGVRGLVAVAQATLGSIENLRLVNAGQLESAFSQADAAGWAYNGTNVFAPAGAQRHLRAIGGLFPEVAHLVVRADGPIRSLADLAGKNVSLGEPGSGTAIDAAILLAASGLGEKDLNRKYLRPGPAAEELKAGTTDALFMVGGYPVPAIRELAAATPIRLIPIEGKLVDALNKDFSYYSRAEIPAGSYPGVNVDTPSLSFSTLWVVSAAIDPDLVYAITQALWHPATVRLLAALDPIGKRIQLGHALDGLSVPLHPGAARFYREAGLSVESAPQAAGGDGGKSQ